MARIGHWTAPVALGLVGLVAGCGTSAPRVTSCGIPYIFTLSTGRQVLSGDCAALILPRPPAVTVRRGDTFSVMIAHEQSGALDLPVPQPDSPAVQLVSLEHARATYRAAQTGRALLVAYHTEFCLGIDPKVGNCPTLAVRVIR